jgi:hypothetical protein
LSSDLDKLSVPDSWRLAGSRTNGPGGDLECVPNYDNPICPGVTRYYVATGSPSEVYEQGAQMVVDAGFTIDSRSFDRCDRDTRGSAGSLCWAQAVADDRRLWVQIWPPDATFSEVEIEDRTGPIVSVAVWRDGKDS